LNDEGGNVLLTYSTYARGLDMLLGTHHYLDLTPEGRREAAVSRVATPSRRIRGFVDEMTLRFH
jgi:predicted dithiol-disulfide oxidoreductase (DUF899 family)